MRSTICLFRNDLRVHDNEVLVTALRTGDYVLPLYCFDPDHFKGTWHFNFAKTGVHRAKFLVESVQNLRLNLRKLQTDLLVKKVSPIEGIKNLVEICDKMNHPVGNVIYQKEVTFEEVNVETNIRNFCESKNIKVTEIWGSSLYNKADLPFRGRGSIPDTYTQFRKDVESKSRVRPLIQTPASLPSLPEGLEVGEIPSLQSLVEASDYQADPRSAFPFTGGETSGLERLHYYLWTSDCVAKYKETRNGLVGQDYSTKFSPWLAAGCLSPRQIYWEIKKYEEKRVGNQSTYWVIFELLWRDYFKMVCFKYGDSVFYETGIQNKKLPWSQDKTKFDAWRNGMTGVPFVDANMRELKHTGWMSNRGRQNVASFLVKDLGLDWRLGAEWFESQLLDHDVCSNYGNWNYAAGIGNDPRENRKFNMVKQGLDYDKDGEFIRLWVKELGELRGGKVHTPWSVSRDLLERSGVEVGVTYPKPLVTAPEWARHTARDNNNSGQKGINFYFKPVSEGAGGQGRPNKNKKKPLRGGRIQ